LKTVLWAGGGTLKRGNPVGKWRNLLEVRSIHAEKENLPIGVQQRGRGKGSPKEGGQGWRAIVGVNIVGSALEPKNDGGRIAAIP